MPQISPFNWLTLFLFFTLILSFIMTKIFTFYNFKLTLQSNNLLTKISPSFSWQW